MRVYVCMHACMYVCVRLSLCLSLLIYFTLCAHAEETEAGALFTWGEGSRGQLGHGEEALRSLPTPRQVDALRAHEVSDLSCGANHTAVITGPLQRAQGERREG
jgi:hypothetical protein